MHRSLSLVEPLFYWLLLWLARTGMQKHYAVVSSTRLGRRPGLGATPQGAP